MMANAGAGKTRVLIDRMLRLLLPPVAAAPEQVLCVTYTRAAASEMHERLQHRALHWSMTDEATLCADLANLMGAAPNAELIRAARQLSARLDEARGGLNIKTMHAFCERLLKRFAPEAGVIPHFSVAEDDAARELYNSAFNTWLTQGDPALVNGFIDILPKENQTEVVKLLHGASDKKLLPHALHFSDSDLAAHYTQKMHAVLLTAPKLNAKWQEVAQNPTLQGFLALMLTKEGTLRKKIDLSESHIAQLHDLIGNYSNALLLEKHGHFCAGLTQVVQHYTHAKKQAAALDFSDLIVCTERLLSRADCAAWVLYKLDGGLKHVLLDEAQDTSPDQWRILNALTDDFFSGNGRHAQPRTMFAVGDVKQSIYGFRGADHANMLRYGQQYAQQAQAAEHDWREVRPGASFRSAPQVLQLADAIAQRTNIDFTPHKAVGSAYRNGAASGYVALLPRAVSEFDAAQLIVQHITALIANNTLLPGTGRAVTYGDIIILVRKRSGVAPLIVNALRAAHVPTQDIDKSPLCDEPVVQLTMALMAFVIRPEDDLTLATLLRGAFGGLSDEELFALCFERQGSVMNALYRRRHQPAYHAVTQRLRRAYVLSKRHALVGDFVSALGPLVCPLVPNSASAFNALQRRAYSYAGHSTPSIAGFLHNLRAYNPQIVNENDRSDNKVRIMTTHSAKGMESGVVFFADGAKSMLSSQPDRFITVPQVDKSSVYLPPKMNPPAPLVQTFKEENKPLRYEEELRLLYVATTRARDILYIVGAGTESDAAYSEFERAMAQLSPTQLPDGTLTLGQLSTLPVRAAETAATAAALPIPKLFYQRAAFEYKHRTLRPSQVYLQQNDLPSTAASQTTGNAQALQRGIVVHNALQLLATLPVTHWAAAWQRLCAPLTDIPPAVLQTTFEKVSYVLQHTPWAALFGAQSRAEVPIAGDVPSIGRIAGRIDRLLVTPQHVLVVDFKTGQLADTLPPQYVAQMNVYTQALATIYGQHSISSALLVIDAPTPYLHVLTGDLAALG